MNLKIRLNQGPTARRIGGSGGKSDEKSGQRETSVGGWGVSIRGDQQ